MREYKLIAHRGSHKFAKENSLFSFFNAINENYYGFECDVRQSKDKKFYIYHDMLYDGKLFKSFNSNEIICDTTEKHFKYDFICILRPLLNDKIIEFVKKNNKELFVYGNYNNNFKYDFPYYIVD